MTDKLIRSWYVLHTKSRFENVVHESLSRKSLEVFLPKMLIRSKRQDRKKMIRVPLFPGYVFVKTDLDPNEHLRILKTGGAVRLIGTTRGPVPVPDENIESLRIMVSGENEVITGSRYNRGDKVMVVQGPFTGVIGSFERYSGKGRVMVHIEALGQFAAVDVDEDDIEILIRILV